MARKLTSIIENSSVKGSEVGSPEVFDALSVRVRYSSIRQFLVEARGLLPLNIALK